MEILVVGSLNIDFRVKVQHLVAEGETELADQLDLIPGGKGANQAFAAGRLGNHTVMLGALGNDSYGALLAESLKFAGVDTTHLAIRKQTSTGIAIVQVDKQGSNSIIVIPGANATVDTAYIDEHLEVLRRCDIVLLQMEIPLETVLYVAKLAKQLGKLVILDPAPAPKSMPSKIYQYIDFIKPNEAELRMLTGERDLEKGMRILLSYGVKGVVVTVGKNGAKMLQQPGGPIITYRTPDVPIVDTTAAGDSFSAAFATALAKGKDTGEAIRYANIVGAIVVSRSGAQTSIPTKEEVDRFSSELSSEYR